MLSNIIKIYLNMYNIGYEKSVKLSTLPKKRRWLSSARKLWISKLNLKHTNDKITINIFIYDRINNVILVKFMQILRRFYYERFINIRNNNFNEVSSKLSSGKEFFSHIRKTNDTLNDKLIENINIIHTNDNGTKTDNSIRMLMESLKIKFLKRILKQEMNILYYKRFIWLNTLKYKSTFIWILQRLINKVYNKNVVFNIISLKNFYLNSDILTQILAHKSRDRKMKVHKLMGNALSIIETPTVKKSMISKVTKNKYSQKIALKDNAYYNAKDNLGMILKNYYNTNFSNTESEVLNSLKNKSIVGVRLEAAGRLTKRFTAERTVKKVNYIGTLKNVDSSFKGMPTEMIRNSKKNNIQLSKAKSQNRIGSFGLKGWINSV